jgi:peroxiredoxin
MLRAVIRRCLRSASSSALREPGRSVAGRLPGLLLACVLAGAFGCSDDPVASASPPALAAAPAGEERAESRGRPLPAIAGQDLDGREVRVASLLGKRLVLFVFNPEVPEAVPVAQAVAAVARARGEHNFQILGVGTGSQRSKVRSFAETHGFDFPVLDDSTAAIASQLGLRMPAALLGVDAEGYLIFGFGGPPPQTPDAARGVELQLREALRLPEAGDGATPVLGERPRAPGLRGVDIFGGGAVDLAALRGQPVVVMFFLHTCPHCHSAMRALRDILPQLPEAGRPRLVGVSVSDRVYSVKDQLESDGFAFFPVVTDPDHEIRSAWGVLAGIPDVFLVDAEGRIQARTQGWRDERDPPLLRMRLARLAGQPAPMLLHQTGYSGNEFCGVCHPRETETWQLDRHAAAYDTLVRHGADRDEECVGCHVVGWKKAGGFTLDPSTPHLEDVGCETCHGRGGPHLSPEFVKNHDYRAACVVCHDQKHSLGFEYAKFLPQVSHAANAHLVGLSLEEKRKLLAERGQPRSDLLPGSAAFVGSEACRSCHEAEFSTWSGGPHAGALRSLEQKRKSAEAGCLRCHTTGFGRPGGFPSDARPPAHPDLARVGCESCHGPGADHVAEGASRRGTIVSLGDKCDSCVILQICGACHDDANDPGFEFEVKGKIEAIRHGTIAPSGG